MSGDFREPRWTGDTRPDFAEGNTLSVVHGANSRRFMRPIVDEVLADLATVAPWATAPAFRREAERYAWAEAACRLRREDLDARGLFDADGGDRPGTDRWERTERLAANLADRLGLTTQSMTRVLAGLSSIDGAAAQDGLDALRAAGHEIRMRAEARALDAARSDEGSLSDRASALTDNARGSNVAGQVQDHPVVTVADDIVDDGVCSVEGGSSAPCQRVGVEDDEDPGHRSGPYS